jgi:hypothetical protein
VIKIINNRVYYLGTHDDLFKDVTEKLNFFFASAEKAPPDRK